MDVTGVLDEDTIEFMEKPRCGVKDFEVAEDGDVPKMRIKESDININKPG